MNPEKCILKDIVGVRFFSNASDQVPEQIPITCSKDIKYTSLSSASHFLKPF